MLVVRLVLAEVAMTNDISKHYSGEFNMTNDVLKV